MDALKQRDTLFSELHRSVLKPLGFAKHGHWSTRQCGAFRQAVYLRASRWSDRERADFWLDLHVYHDGFHKLLTGQSFAAPKESAASVIYEILGEKEGPAERQQTISNNTDVEALRHLLERRLIDHAVAMFERVKTLEEALAYVRSSKQWPRIANVAAALCLLLGRQSEAVEYMRLAKESAPHENTVSWLKQQQETMLKNLALITRAPA